MKAYIIVNMMGAFAFDDTGNLIGHKLFPAKPEEIAERLSAREHGGSVNEELELIEELGRKGYSAIFSKKDSDFNFRAKVIELGWVKSNAELNQLLSKVNVLLTRGKLSVVRSDRVLMQVVGIIDDMDRFLNVFSERLREWHGMLSGESAGGESNEGLAKAIACSRNKKFKELSGFAKGLSGFFSLRKELGAYLDGLGRSTAPNLSAVAGTILAARLLEIAGGLDKLAKMSSSKIQLLGAEKALFRHLKGQGRSPKYGVIFAHPYVQKASRENKGKVARLVAAKLSLAARVDFFSKDDRSADMKKELERQVKGLI